jgi:hypothetical protein
LRNGKVIKKIEEKGQQRREKWQNVANLSEVTFERGEVEGEEETGKEETKMGKRVGRGINPKYDNFLMGEESLIGHKRLLREGED